MSHPEPLQIELIFKDDVSEALEDALWFQLFDLLGIELEDEAYSPGMDKDG